MFLFIFFLKSRSCYNVQKKIYYPLLNILCKIETLFKKINTDFEDDCESVLAKVSENLDSISKNI